MLVLAFMKCTNNFQDFLVDVSYCSSNAEGIAFLPFCKMQNNFQWLFCICSVSLTFSGREENMSTVHVQHATKKLFFPVWLCTRGIPAVWGEESCIFMLWHRQTIIPIAFKVFNDIIYLSRNNCNHFGFIIHHSLEL